MKSIPFLCLLCLFAATFPGCGGSDETNDGGSSGGASTPEEAVARMHAALEAGDATAMAEVMAPPWDGFLRNIVETPPKLAAAQQNLDAALDSAFGPRQADAELAFGSKLADSILTDLKRTEFGPGLKIESLKIVDKSEQGGKLILTVEGVAKSDQGTSTNEDKFLATENDGIWKLAPVDKDPVEPQERLDAMSKLLETYATVTREVQDGQFKARWEVDRYMTWSLLPNAPWLFLSSSPPDEYRDDLDALGLIPLDVPDDPLYANIRVSSDSIYLDALTIEAKELTPRLKQLREEHPLYRIRVMFQPGPNGSAATLNAALAAILDSGDDVPRVELVFDDEKQYEQLAKELTGRLRLFTMRNMQPKAEEELMLDPEAVVPIEPFDPSIERAVDSPLELEPGIQQNTEESSPFDPDAKIDDPPTDISPSPEGA